MLLIASCTVMTVAAGVFVLLPLFRESASGLDIELMAESELDRLADRKAAIYGNLKDLAFEYEMGRLSEEDFRQLEAGYKTDAALILQKLDQLGEEEGLDASLERDIASVKNADSVNVPDLTEVEARCPYCEAELIPGKNFCADCGHELKI